MKINSLWSKFYIYTSKLSPLTIIVFAILISQVAYSQQLAFPTATGAGAYVTGGRGMQVFIVTNLNDSGPGSLRQAVDDSFYAGGGIITFAVSGTIELQNVLSVSTDNLTIAGHTAPAGGITITGNKVAFNNVDNLIVRYVRFRPDYTIPTNVTDGARFLNCTNYIVDHCSFSWGADEVVSTTGNTYNVTWQNNLIAEGKTGSLFGDSDNPSLSYNLSFQNNLYYNITHRFPNVNTNGRADVINNVVFNWKFRLTSAQGDFQLNHINNYYSKGCVNDIDGIVNKLDLEGTPELYTAGNYVTDDLTDPNADNLFLWEYFNTSDFSTISSQYQVNTSFNLLGNPMTVRSAVDAFDYVTNNVGANAYLDANGNSIANSDSLDIMYLDHTIAGDCIDYVSYSAYQDYEENQHYIDFHNNVSSTPINTGYQDSNNDGMPDAWKQARGFGINDNLTTYEWPSGYVGIEEFLNEIDANAVQTVDVTGVSVSPQTATINVPETVQLTATIAPNNATNQNGVWSSSDDTIATVSNTGVVTAVSEGDATITFTTNDGGFTDSATITVTNVVIDVASVAVTPESGTIDLGETIQLNAVIMPVNATNQNGTWSSSNPAIASVNDQGVVTGNAVGSATITYTTEEGSFTDSAEITVVDVFFGTYELYNAQTDVLIQNITEDTSFDLNVIGDQINFRSIPEGGDANSNVESVRVEWTGVETGSWTESTPIYAGMTDHFDFDFAPYTVLEGTYNFTVTYFSQDNASGNVVAIDTFSLTFFFNSALVANAGDDQSICEGESATLTASGGINYLWDNGATTATIEVNPQQTTTYTVTVSDNDGNSDTDSVTVTVNPIPEVTVSNDITIELGQSTTLTASGTDSYQWNTGQTAVSISVAPTETTTYTVVGTTNGCSAEASVTVTVIEVFQASAGEDQRVCMGDDYEVVLTASEGDTYLWSTGETTQSITVSPLSTTMYTVTVTQGNEQDSDDVVVFVDPNPNVVILNGESVQLLEGEFITLSASGANTYEWSNGATQPNIAVSPSVTTTYTARGYINDCYDEKDVTVEVFERVNAFAGDDMLICLGDLVTLTATGGDSYLWSTGETTQSIEVSPEISTTYTVTVSNPLDSDEATVFVEVDAECNDVIEPGAEVNYEFMIYPNPAKDILNIKLSGVFNVSSMYIYDTTGKILLQDQVSNTQSTPTMTRQIDVSSFQSGIYFVKLIDNDREITRKLIVQ